jgi:hypothetical protein
MSKSEELEATTEVFNAVEQRRHPHACEPIDEFANLEGGRINPLHLWPD